MSCLLIQYDQGSILFTGSKHLTMAFPSVICTYNLVSYPKANSDKALFTYIRHLVKNVIWEFFCNSNLLLL